MEHDQAQIWVSKDQITDHIRDFGGPQVAKGKTVFFERLTQHLAERKKGLGWKAAWALRLADLGNKNQLPRGFNADALRDRQVAGRRVLAIKPTVSVSYDGDKA